MALPLDVTRMVVCTDMPITLPCQEPARVFSFSNAFCASDCGPDVFGAGIFISCGNTTAAAATRMIRSVSFRIGSPFSSTVSTHNLSMAETNAHDATYQEHDRRLQGASDRCLTRRLPDLSGIDFSLCLLRRPQTKVCATRNPRLQGASDSCVNS